MQPIEKMTLAELEDWYNELRGVGETNFAFIIAELFRRLKGAKAV